MSSSKAHEAQVRNGRLVLDEPTDLPEGTVVALFDDPFAYLDATDDMEHEERERLHASIERGLAEMRAGLGRPAEDVIAGLRRRG
jgi:hypothetical protein